MNIIARVQVGPYDPHNVHIVSEKLFDEFNGDVVEYLMYTGDIQEEWVLVNVTITNRKEPDMSDQTMKTIENATDDDVQRNDRVVRKHTWEHRGMIRTEIREGTAHHRDEDGDWRTNEGGLLTFKEGDDSNVTHTISRIVPTLPTNHGDIIESGDGCEFIEAEYNGTTYYAREARLSNDAWWAIWRTDTGEVLSYLLPKHITTDTWKKSNG